MFFVHIKDHQTGCHARIQWFAILFGIFLASGMLVLFFEPRVKVAQQVDKQAADIPEAVALDTYLASAEATIPDLIPGTEKIVRWAVTPGVATPVSLVYLHGFSSSRQEVWPLMEQVADALQANLFYARLRGHGRTGEALAAASVVEWQQDALQALAIGQRLGERVVLVATSNGATLATWLATQPGAAELAALVLMSPNYGPRDPLSELLLWPWAHLLVRWIVGSEYQWTPQNPEHARYWTWHYPSEALLTMMGVVKLARHSPVEQIRTPLLVLYAPDDQVVNAKRIERFFRRFGTSDKRLMPLDNTTDRQHHMLAGDILAPEDTARVRDLMVEFLRPRLGDH